MVVVLPVVLPVVEVVALVVVWSGFSMMDVVTFVVQVVWRERGWIR